VSVAIELFPAASAVLAARHAENLDDPRIRFFMARGSRCRVDPGEPAAPLVDFDGGARRPGFREL
jgi:hypothetical protein